MRDLSTSELSHVYGAGGRGCSPKPPKRKKTKCRGGSSGGSGSRGGSGSGSGSRGRCGKGGSS